MSGIIQHGSLRLVPLIYVLFPDILYFGRLTVAPLLSTLDSV